MKIINPGNSDYHMHSTNFSDGTSSIDEIVRFAGEIGMDEIAITDHSDAGMKNGFRKTWDQGRSFYGNIDRWKNVFNNVKVILGVEGDLLDEDGKICSTIQGIEPGFIILSAHLGVYNGKKEKITDAYINAIEKYHEKIKFIGHPCNSRCFAKYLDIEKLVNVCNEYKIPLEFDASDLVFDFTDIDKLHYILKNSDYIYVNSDAHSLYELKEHRKIAFDFLREHGYID